MRRLVLLTIIAGLAVVLGSAARATPPQHLPVLHVDDTFTVPAAPEGPCSFEVEVHVVGDIRTIVFFDQQGNEVRGVDVSNLRISFSANGKTITTVAAAPRHFTFNPDGSVVVTITGLQGHLIVGGGPPQASDVGRIVLFFSSPEDEEPDILFQAGSFNFGPYPQLCDVLADP